MRLLRAVALTGMVLSPLLISAQGGSGDQA
jgi:hypothetical protein